MRSSIRRTKDLAVFAVLGSIMFVSQIAMDSKRPFARIVYCFIYIDVSGTGVDTALCLRHTVWCVYGFSTWWFPYLYIWLPLWGMFMVVGSFDSRLPMKLKIPLYMVLCGLHGLSFGALYTPFQAMVWGLNFKGAVAWFISGLPFDVIHAVGNFAAGTMIIPLTALLRKLDKNLYGA